MPQLVLECHYLSISLSSVSPFFLNMCCGVDLGLLEELFIDDPWKLLVTTICLNVVSAANSL